MSRQSLSTLEAGRCVPSAALALRLAQELGCKVEELFWFDDQPKAITVELAAEGGDDAASPNASHADTPDDGKARKKRAGAVRAVHGPRVAVASIDGRWVAHPLSATDVGSLLTAADGFVSGPGPQARGQVGRGIPATVTLFDGASAARDTVLCAGCAPSLGLLAARTTAARPGPRVVWLERSSTAALELLSRGQVHVAGAHLLDEESQEFNLPFVKRRFQGRSMLLFNLTRWQTGLVMAPGNPRQIRGVGDLIRPDVSFVRRQEGAASQDLIERLLRREGVPPQAAFRDGPVARGHMEVARLVAMGMGDVGVALLAMARAFGLEFIPLAEERFDLVLPKELSSDARVVRFLDTLCGRSFRREIESLGGHVARDSGQLIGDTGGGA